MDDRDGNITPDGEDNHVLEGTICWCNPEVVNIDGTDYILHKDIHGNTIQTDPKFNKKKLVN